MNSAISRRQLLRWSFGATAVAMAGTFVTSGGKRVATAVASTFADPVASPVPGDNLLLRITYTGGYVPPEFFFTEMPFFSLYESGLLITTGPMIEIYPQPALPNLRQTVLSESGVAKIVAAAKDAGLFAGSADLDGPPVADVGSTVFTTNENGKTAVVSAYALGFDESQVADSALRAARQKLIDFSAQLMNLPEWLEAADLIDGESPYTIERIRLFNREIDPASPPWQDSAMEQPAVAWPLDLPITDFGDIYEGPYQGETTCGVVEGEEAAQLVKLLEGMNQLSPWESGGVLYQTWVRPLLPDESGCR